jgi:hypothetical protein
VLQISKKLVLKQKEVTDVLGGEDAWKNVDRTAGVLLLLLLLLLFFTIVISLHS